MKPRPWPRFYVDGPATFLAILLWFYVLQGFTFQKPIDDFWWGMARGAAAGGVGVATKELIFHLLGYRRHR